MNIKLIKNIFMIILALFILGCSTASTIQRADQSKSAFDDAVYEGEQFNVNNEVLGNTKYRIFHQASTGFTSIQSIRESASKRSEDFCKREGKAMRIIKEHTSTLPHILGNFPRIEIIFTCIDESKIAKPSNLNNNKYIRLRNIKSLLDDGILTNNEFEIEKQSILSE